MIRILSLEIEGYTRGMVERPCSLSPVISQKSPAWLVVHIISVLERMEMIWEGVKVSRKLCEGPTTSFAKSAHGHLRSLFRILET